MYFTLIFKFHECCCIIMSLTKTKNKRTIPLAFLNITEDHCLFLQLVIYLQTKKSILPYGSPE